MRHNGILIGYDATGKEGLIRRGFVCPSFGFELDDSQETTHGSDGTAFFVEETLFRRATMPYAGLYKVVFICPTVHTSVTYDFNF